MSPMKPAMRRTLLAIAAMIAAPAAGKTATLTGQNGQWYQVFPTDVESAIGHSVRVDAASITTGGLGRQFRQANVLLRAEGSYPYGTVIYAARSVNCAASQQVTYSWSAVSPTGAVLSSQTSASPQVQTVHWDSEDGKVLRFVCNGILPR